MSEFIVQLEKLFSAIGDPEYRYLLIEPLIFYGLFVGVIMLGVGFAMKAQRLQVSALVVLMVSALAYFPYKDARLAAQPRMEQVYKTEFPARVSGFAKNTKDWIATSWQFRLLVLCAGAALVIGIHRHRIGLGLAVVSMLLALLASKNALWLNYQDAIAYHPNLKLHDAPVDRRVAHVSSPPVNRKGKERRSTKIIAEPISASVLVPTAAPPPAHERIAAPLPPAAPLPRAREVHPLRR